MSERKRRADKTRPSVKRSEGKPPRKYRSLKEKHQTWKRPKGAVDYDPEETL